MKFAFRTVSRPDRDWEAVASRAREYGYQGVEIREPPADLESIRSAFAAAGVEVACLDGGAGMTGRPREDAARAAAVRNRIDVAQRLDCRLVSVPDMPLSRGWSRSAAQVALGDWLLPLGDYAAGRGVTIVVENALSFLTAGDLWTVLDRIDHPAVAACWDVCRAAEAGESPLVSVPVLNRRIRHTRVGDATSGPVRAFVTRLRGVGYDGYLCVDSGGDDAVGPTDTGPALQVAVGALKAWVAERAVTPGESDSKPAAPPRRK